MTFDRRHFTEAVLQLWSAVRRVFHWRISQALILLCFATGVGTALAERFALAYFFFVLFGIWSVLCWFASDLLAKKKSELEKLEKKTHKISTKPKKIAEYKKAHRTYLLYFKIGVPVMLIGLMAACLAEVQSIQREYELSLPNGWLIPANDELPQSDCSPAANELALYMGTNASVSGKFPHTLIQYRGKDVLSIDRNDKNQIAVTVEVRGVDDKLIATIDKNNFNLTQNALQTHKPRPDRNTFVVYDEYGNQALNVRYLNPRAIRISGTLYYGGHRIDLPIRGTYDSCSHSNGVDMVIG